MFDKGFEPLTGGTAGEAYQESGQLIIDIDNNLVSPRTTVAHELFHTIQMTIDPSIFAPWIDEEWWLIEGTARWMEDAVYDDANSYVWNGLNHFLQFPDSTLNSVDNRYRSVLSRKYLTEHFGTDGDGNPAYSEHGNPNKIGMDDNGVDFMRDLWTACQSADGIQAVDDALSGHGSFFELAFSGWLGNNLRKDLGDPFGQGFLDYLEDENGYTSIRDYIPARMRISVPPSGSLSPISPQVDGEPVQPWAAHFIVMPLTPAVASITVDFNAENDFPILAPNRFEGIYILFLQDADDDGQMDFVPLTVQNSILDGANTHLETIPNDDFDEVVVVITGADNGGQYDLTLSTEAVAGAPGPTAIGTSPVDGGPHVDPHVNIIIRFSNPMDFTTLKAASVSVIGATSGQHAAIYSYSGSTRTLTVNPFLDFDYAETVTITIGTQAVSQTGTPLDAPYTFRLTTRPESLPIDEHGGSLVQDETWAADRVHLVTGSITIASGVTLAIAPGTVVRFGARDGNSEHLRLDINAILTYRLHLPRVSCLQVVEMMNTAATPMATVAPRCRRVVTGASFGTKGVRSILLQTV